MIIDTNYPEKRFLLKVYDKSWVFKETISPKRITNDISFTSQLNWWQGEIRFWYAVDYTDTQNNNLRDDFGYDWIKHWDIIKLYLDIKWWEQGKHIYTGYISKIKRTWNDRWNVLEFTALWLWTLFTKILYQHNWGLQFIENDNPTNILQRIVNKVNIYYPFFTLISDTYTWWNINIELTNIDCLTAIKNTVEKTARHYFIDFDGKIYFSNPVNATNHILRFGYDVEEIVIDEDSENMYNDISIAYAWYWFVNFIDTTSINIYWIKQHFEDKQDILGNFTATKTGNDLLSKNKNHKVSTNLIVIRN